ncbi:MAG TPA: hypothetical protein VM532_03115 [Burkholderiales bacterium]|nr:hypothetical protein [Burkholderiales bacterium]
MNTRQYARKIAAMGLAGVVISVFGASNAEAADGDLDPNFGDNGAVTTDFFGRSDFIGGIAIEKNGKIVAVGSAVNDPFAGDQIALARYNKDGSLDRSFGDGGKVIMQIPLDTGGFFISDASGVAILHDNKILIAGRVFNPVTSRGNFALLRYQNNGQLDQRFGEEGIAITEFEGVNSSAGDLALQPDGKIVALGTVTSSNDFSIALARYNPDGQLDDSFGNGGKVVTNIARIETASAVHLTKDGKILVTGRICALDSDSTCSRTDEDFILLRYNSDGSLDSSFGNEGKVTVNVDVCDAGNAIDVAPDGRITVAGGTSGFRPCRPLVPTTSFVILRFTPDGVLDASFGTEGKVRTSFGGPEGGSYGTDVAIVRDEFNLKIVVGGYFREGPASQAGSNVSDFIVARYLWNGSVDASFGRSGMATADFGGTQDRTSSLAIQRNGDIVLAGFATQIGSFSDFAIARFLSDDCPLSFLNDGKLKRSITSPLLNPTIDLLDDFVGCRDSHF